MWLEPLHRQMGPELWAAWNRIMHAGLSLVRDDPARGEEADPWLFHGTTAARAGSILREGFTPGRLHMSPGRGYPETTGVYWGHPSVAAAFAHRYASCEDLPVMFAARASQVALGTPDGILRPDHYACEEQGCPSSYPDGMDYDHPGVRRYDLGSRGVFDHLDRTSEDGFKVETWEQSLCYGGAVTAPGGRHVPGLFLFAVPPALLPARTERLLIAPPGMEISHDPRDALGARDVGGMEEALETVRIRTPVPLA